MTPKEKAEELIGKFTKLDIEIGGQFDGYLTMKNNDAKQCALIAVDEIINNIINTPTDYGASWTYFQEVKQEIEKL